MALCRRGSFLVRSAASAVAASCEPFLAAPTSFNTAGGGGRVARANLSYGGTKRGGQPRGIAAVTKFLGTEANRLLSFARLTRQHKGFVVVWRPAGTQALGGKRFSSFVPAVSPAAGFKVLLGSSYSGDSQASLRSMPAALSVAVSGRPHVTGFGMDVGSPSAATWSPAVALPGIMGFYQGPQQHSLTSRRSFAGQQQSRGFAFPSLRFFANSGVPSSETATPSFARSSAGGSVQGHMSAQQLQMLQQQAEAHLDDEHVQQRYLAALNAHGESYRAVEHVEKFGDKIQGMSEAALIEYVKALCSSGLIHQQGRSISQVVNKYLSGGGRLVGGSPNAEASRDGPTNSSLTSLLQQHQAQQQQLLQQQLTVQLQQLVHQLQVDGVQRRAASFTSPGSDAAVATEGEIVKLANAAAAAGRLSASATSPLTGWRRYSPLRVVKWFCRALWGLLKACNFLNDGVQAMQNSVKNMEGNGGLGNQTGGKKASDWVAGKVVKPEEVNTSFADVKGCEEVKKEVVEVVEYLKAPAKFTAMGARLPKGVLLQGPPGTGKTLLARAIAGEAGVPFIHASGSDFEEMYVGVGASRLRQLFAEARKRSPCILFIDEIDALGGRRTLTENKHHRQTLNQLLTELDGFKPSDGVTLICATNLAEALDPALTRPGRIDRIIHVPLPCKKERVDILQHYAVKMPLAEDVDLDLLASLTSGMTGADLANLLNFAAIRAATEGKLQVTLAEVEESFDRLMVGNRRSSVVMKEEERKVTAYHEVGIRTGIASAPKDVKYGVDHIVIVGNKRDCSLRNSGHALMCLYTPGSLPLHKATILFRGSALGVTWSVNREESFSKSLREYLASLDVAMGGKAAEEIVFGKGNVTSGCFNDLQKATRVARDMVTGFGMGVEDSKAPMVISGKEYSFLSDESKKKVDEAVQRLLDQSYDRARTLLTEKRDELERLAQALLEHETLTAEEIRAAVAGTIDSAAIRERRKQKASAARPPARKVNGDEGESEEEQQPPSALLRASGSSSESPINSRNSENSHVEVQANDGISSEFNAQSNPAWSSGTSVDESRSATASTSVSQNGLCTPRDNGDGFSGETEAGGAGNNAPSSDARAQYAVTDSATVAAVSALLAVATQDPQREKKMEKQQEPVVRAVYEEAVSRGGHRRVERTVQEPHTEITKAPVCVTDSGRCVKESSVSIPLDTSDTEKQRLDGPMAGDGKEDNGKESVGSAEIQQKPKSGGDLVEKKGVGNSGGEHDRSRESAQ